MIYIIGLVLSIAFLLIAIIKFEIHPFFVLVISALGYGLITGMDYTLIIDSINEGFGGLLGKVGLIIIFGIAIGTILEKSGGALVIATKVLKIIGEKSVHLAMMVSGYILSIPVFADSGFIILNPLNKVLSKKANVSYAGTTAALAFGLMASHVMVPPTPGPITAAELVGADLGYVIIFGLIVSSISLVSCYIFSITYASKIKLEINLQPTQKVEKKPPFWKSMLAIIIPIALIVLKSVAEYPTEPFGSSQFVSLIKFIGTPVIALLLGLLIALTVPTKWEKKIISGTGWLGETIVSAAPILLITGAGGIFGKMLQNSGLGDLISNGISFTELQLFFPFILAACLKTAQGSSTVALITTASILAPLMEPMGLNTPMMSTLTVLAIGAGSTVTSHVNDSFFWIMTQLTGMTVKQGNQIQSLGTAIFGFTAIIIIFLISLFVA